MITTDCYTKQGAERIARTIERAWRNNLVKVWIEQKAVPGHTFPLWFVRSNLVNGLPPRAKNARVLA